MAGRAGKVRDGTVGDDRKSGRRNKCWYDSPNLIGCFTPKKGDTKGKGALFRPLVSRNRNRRVAPQLRGRSRSTLGKPNPESDLWVHDIELSLIAEKYDEFRVGFTYQNLIGVETKE
ncbi:hypothetical protein GW17_00034781 [Ensete ventricosum]|nr:hypothetical protein GW17_00034781 [Ensete ventricosum]RZS26298.1 hypothetical protein BHM03_00059618 [Ensete ventricosum]